MKHGFADEEHDPNAPAGPAAEDGMGESAPGSTPPASASPHSTGSDSTGSDSTGSDAVVGPSASESSAAESSAEGPSGEGPSGPGLAHGGHATRTAARGEASAPEAPKAQPQRLGPDGEPIPDDAYVVELPSFEGPLDRLLHLIQKHELDILDIPVGFVTEKYLAYLEVMRTLSLDVASEYLVMAATLALIKSRMLLPDDPNDQAEDGDEEEEDPRAELVRRLLEYQKYKAAAEQLGRRDTLGSQVFARGSDEPVPEGPAPFAPVGSFDLLDAFAKVLSRAKIKIEHEVVFDRISISDRITELVDFMQKRRSMPFDELFVRGAEVTRFELVITFLAVLEMVRLKMLRVFQVESLSPIHVELMVLDADSVTGDGADPLAMRPSTPPGAALEEQPRAAADLDPREFAPLDQQQGPDDDLLGQASQGDAFAEGGEPGALADRAETLEPDEAELGPDEAELGPDEAELGPDEAGGFPRDDDHDNVSGSDDLGDA